MYLLLVTWNSVKKFKQSRMKWNWIKSWTKCDAFIKLTFKAFVLHILTSMIFFKKIIINNYKILWLWGFFPILVIWLLTSSTFRLLPVATILCLRIIYMSMVINFIYLLICQEVKFCCWCLFKNTMKCLIFPSKFK